MSIVPAEPKLTVDAKEMSPLVEDNIPALIARESFNVRSDDPVRSFSPAASIVNGSLMVVAIVMLNAEPFRSTVPNLVTSEFQRVESACRVSLVVRSVIVPASSRFPPNLS